MGAYFQGRTPSTSRTLRRTPGPVVPPPTPVTTSSYPSLARPRPSLARYQWAPAPRGPAPFLLPWIFLASTPRLTFFALLAWIAPFTHSVPSATFPIAVQLVADPAQRENVVFDVQTR